MSLVLVGNKIDLVSERQITTQEGQSFANKHNMLFVETSAKTSERITDVFVKSANLVNGKIVNKQIDPRNETYGVKMGNMLTTDANVLNKTNLMKKEKTKCC